MPVCHPLPLTGGTMKPRRDMPPPRLSLPGFSANHTSWHIVDPRLTLGSSLPAQPYFIPPSTRRGRITFHLPMNSGILKWHDHWWKHHACMAPIVSEALRTRSDGGCCFSSCLLYKLIWPETFASLGAGRKKKLDVMPADTSWRPSPLLTPGALGGVWCSTSQPTATQISPRLFFLTEGGEQREMWNTENTMVCGARIETTPPPMFGENSED